MLNARNDKVIPPDCTTALWEAAGKPEIEWWDADHYSAIWYLPKALVRMVDFFQPDTAGQPQPAPPALAPRRPSSAP